MGLLQELMRRLVPLLAAFAAILPLPAAAQTAALQEGKQYIRLKNPQPVETGKKIEVIEFFSYGCPHCGDLEPVLQGWLKTMPADVEFRRIPVMFRTAGYRSRRSTTPSRRSATRRGSRPRSSSRSTARG